MNNKIKQVTISRSYDRKITGDKQYEMVGFFSSYNAVLETPTEKDIEETSKWLFEKAQADVDLQVDIRQNPQKVVRGYSSINEMRTLIKSQGRVLEEQQKEINNLKLRIKQEAPF